jgi:ribokinase
MTIYNFGSLNIDHVYRIDHSAAPGETVACDDFSMYAGGKGANQSIAIARAGGTVCHVGKIGYDGLWMVENMKNDGVDTQNIFTSTKPTGHAIVMVDRFGQNSIVIYGGTNKDITTDEIDTVLSKCQPKDIVLLQNEISNVGYLISQAADIGLEVVFNPAPMTSDVFSYALENISMLIINEREGQMLSGKTVHEDIISAIIKKYPHSKVVLTLGENGAVYADGSSRVVVHGCQVDVVDATGAGDAFIGYMLAGIQKGKPIEYCMSFANKAAALSVTRKGATASIPMFNEVEIF